jgi:predicted esterase
LNPHLVQPVVRHGCALSGARLAAILVHGRGRDPQEMIRIADRLRLEDVAYLAPAAFENSWYPNRFMEPLAGNQPMLDHALECLKRLVTGLAADGFDPGRIVLLGFSQGACLTTEYAVRNARRYGGIVAFTGGLIGPPGTSWDFGGGFEDTPVFLGTSDVDEWVPAPRVVETAKLMSKLGARVTMEIYPGLDHSVCDDEIRRARDLIRGIRAGADGSRA